MKGLFGMIFYLMFRRINMRSKALHSVVVLAMLFTFMVGAVHHHDDARSHNMDCVTCATVAHSPALTTEAGVDLAVYADYLATLELEGERVVYRLVSRSSAPRAPPAV